MRGCYAVTIDGAISFAVHSTQRVPNHDTQRILNHDTNTVTHHHEPDRLADRTPSRSPHGL